MSQFVNIHTHHVEHIEDVINIVDYFTTLNEKKDNIKLFSSGIHPWFINEQNLDVQFKLLHEISLTKNCKAIGECGLDKLKGPHIDVQKAVFEQQIVLAIELKKPIIVHCVKAFDTLSAIVKKYQKKVIFIIHGFNQNEQIAWQLLKQGFYLSFGSALLNSKNERLKNIFIEVPVRQLFLETDQSEQSIKQIYEAAAQIKKYDVNTMKEIIFANYKTVFKHE